MLDAAASGRLTADWRESHDAAPELPALIAQLAEERHSLSKGRAKAPLLPYRAASLLSLPASWQWIAADAACSLITKGTTPPSQEMAQGAGEIPYLKVYNLTFDGTVNFAVAPTFVSHAIHDGLLKRSRVFPGDVLMNIVGPPLGKVAVVPGDYPEWNINQAIAVLRPLPSMRSDFLARCLLSPQIAGLATRRAKATAGQYNLTLEICREIALPLPPPSEQAEIMRRVDRLLGLVDVLHPRIVGAANQIENSSHTVLTKAFRGELTQPS